MSNQPTSFRPSNLTKSQIACLAQRTGLRQNAIIMMAIDRMAREELKSMETINTIKTIRIEYSADSLWGSEDPVAQGYDPAASSECYADLLAAALKRDYPGADIEIEETINDYAEVDGARDSLECAAVDDVQEEVFGAGEWYVKA